MFVRKEIVKTAYTILESSSITRIWANDGWCYIPELKRREKFVYKSADLIEFCAESYEGIIPSKEHEEVVQYHLITRKPLAWAEKTQWGHEIFSETKASLRNN